MSERRGEQFAETVAGRCHFCGEVLDAGRCPTTCRNNEPRNLLQLLRAAQERMYGRQFDGDRDA